MNPFVFPTVCDVCGGEGRGTFATAGAMWDSCREVRHNDPRVCAAELAKRARALDLRDAAEHYASAKPAKKIIKKS